MNEHLRDTELEEKIDDYIKGHLNREEVDALWVRLLENPEYIPLLETEIDLARLHADKKRQKPTIIRYWKWVAAAAAVALLIVSINLFNGDSQKPIEEWAQAKISLSENLASAEVTRSESNISTSDSLLNAGFMSALEGNTKQASAIYEKLSETSNNPEVVAKANLNLGILQYNAGEHKASIQRFNRAISFTQNDVLLQERAYWYLSQAFIKINRLKDARTAARETYEMGQIYKEEAFKLMKQLDYELGRIDSEKLEQQLNEPE